MVHTLQAKRLLWVIVFDELRVIWLNGMQLKL